MTDNYPEVQEAIDSLKFTEARDLLTPIIQNEPTAEAYYMFSLTENDPNQKQRYLQKAIELDPNHSKSLSALNLKQPEIVKSEITESATVEPTEEAIAEQSDETVSESAVDEDCLYVTATIVEPIPLYNIPHSKGKVVAQLQKDEEFILVERGLLNEWFYIINSSDNLHSVRGWITIDKLQNPNVCGTRFDLLRIPITQYENMSRMEIDDLIDSGGILSLRKAFKESNLVKYSLYCVLAIVIGGILLALGVFESATAIVIVLIGYILLIVAMSLPIRAYNNTVGKELKHIKRVRDEMKSDREVRNETMIRGTMLDIAKNVTSSVGDQTAARIIKGKRR